MNEPIIDPTGPSLGSLRIYTRREEAFSGLPLLGQMVAVWRLHNHQAGVWKMGRALIQQTGNYRVSLAIDKSNRTPSFIVNPLFHSHSSPPKKIKGGHRGTVGFESWRRIHFYR